MTSRYYEEEMQYLQEAAKAFADSHPERAQYLNIDSVSDRDPYVERLFEGFAFLTGRIHERLDDEMSEYTESLIQFLQPHFLKPVPALSILEFAPKPGMVQETMVLEEGHEVRSEPVGAEGVRCRFRTAYDVRVQPLRLEEVTLHYASDNTSSARFRFELDGSVSAGELELSPLRLFFHADSSTASTMHMFFTRRVDRVEITAEGNEQAATLRGQKWVQPVGFQPEEGLFPSEEESFSGFRLLQEYLCFRRKFWFADLQGVDQGPLEEAEAFTVEVFFDRPYPEERAFDSDNVRLHCAPVVNVFSLDAEPIRIEGEVAEHRVIPSVRHSDGIQAYDVQKVVGTEDTTGRSHEYKPFLSFEHSTNGQGPADGRERFFMTSRRPGPAEHPDIYLSLSDAHLDTLRNVPAETLSVDLRCTNGNLPRRTLQEGTQLQLGSDVPDVVQPTLLAQPTQTHRPPQQEENDFFWKLISHWSLNFQSIADRGALTGLLELYDWTSSRVNRRRIDGIESVQWESKERIEHGAVIRGSEVTMEVTEDHFADEGDLCLFGLVLSRFLSAYATINSFVHLTIVSLPSEQRYEWTPNRGTRRNV